MSHNMRELFSECTLVFLMVLHKVSLASGNSVVCHADCDRSYMGFNLSFAMILRFMANFWPKFCCLTGIVLVFTEGGF